MVNSHAKETHFQRMIFNKAHPRNKRRSRQNGNRIPINALKMYLLSIKLSKFRSLIKQSNDRMAS